MMMGLPSQSWGFNGAAVRKRRRVCEHGGVCGQFVGSFNGAAVRKRRRENVALLLFATRDGFNGAAVRKRRRAPSFLPAVLARDCQLQWGRRSKTAEGARLPDLRATSRGASMGPPFENGGGAHRGTAY